MKLVRRTPEQQIEYLSLKYAELQAEKQELLDRLAKLDAVAEASRQGHGDWWARLDSALVALDAKAGR
jgi:phage-related minor tail protein